MSSSSEKVKSVLGFDPVKRDPITQDVLNKVLEKKRAERRAEAETRAEGIISQVLDLNDKFEKTKKEFQKAEQAYEKTVGQLLNQLQGKSQEGQQNQNDAQPQQSE